MNASWQMIAMLGIATVVAEADALIAAESPTSRPNIVFVLFDDMGYGQPRSYRADSEFKTPNLDRLAREGMRFTDAHTAASVCTPTRYGVLTGRYPSRIGQFGVLTTFSPPIIPRERMTVASLLKQHGYHTGCIGKWHLGMNWDRNLQKQEEAAPIGARATDGPTAIGFDVFAGYTHARNIGMIIEQDAVVAHVSGVETQPLLAKKAVEYLDSQAKARGPFFLYLPLCPPHTPIVPAAEFVGQSGVDQYGDWLYQGDWVLGQVLEALDRNGQAANTLVIATSDNGAAGRAYAPLRASKSSIYEGGHRVPFLARWPGQVRPGTVCDDTICLNDLLATSAEIVGARLPDNAGEDSVSLLPALLGMATGPVREATVHQSPAGDLAIRQRDWKLIFLSNGKRELYNLTADLSEQRNVADAHPEVVARLTNLMQQTINNGRSTPGVPQKNGTTISLDGKAKGQEKPSAAAGEKKAKKSRKKSAAADAIPLQE
jgi:arylsulfatase A